MAGKTTRAGLGHSHQLDRRAAMAALIPGSPCPRCGMPMFKTERQALSRSCPPWMGRLDLDHVVPRLYGGGKGPKVLSHAKCNRSAGQKITMQIRRTRKALVRSGRW